MFMNFEMFNFYCISRLNNIQDSGMRIFVMGILHYVKSVRKSIIIILEYLKLKVFLLGFLGYV